MVKKFPLSVKRISTPLKFVLIAGTMILIFGVISYIPHRHEQDKIKKQLLSDTVKWFGPSGTTESSVRNYYSQQAAALGLAAGSPSIARTCYMYQSAGGGPSTEGPELRCEVSITKQIPIPRDITKARPLFDSLQKVLTTEGMTTKDTATSMNYDRTSARYYYLAIKWSDAYPYYPDVYACSTYVKSQNGAFSANDGNIIYSPDLGEAGKLLTSQDTQALLYYKLNCFGGASYVPSGYTYLN